MINADPLVVDTSKKYLSYRDNNRERKEIFLNCEMKIAFEARYTDVEGSLNFQEYKLIEKARRRNLAEVDIEGEVSFDF